MGAPDDLKAVFAAGSADEARALYDDLAERYERDHVGRGLRVHNIIAAYLTRFNHRNDAPTLDAACGTGLIGEALSILGFRGLVGCDLSYAMLSRAAARGIYNQLALARLPGPLPFQDNSFAAVVCGGAFGPGHAPPQTLSELVRVAGRGCPIVFNLREDTFVAQGFQAAMDALTRSGAWRELDRSDAFPSYLLAEPELLTRVFVFRAM